MDGWMDGWIDRYKNYFFFCNEGNKIDFLCIMRRNVSEVLRQVFSQTCVVHSNMLN